MKKVNLKITDRSLPVLPYIDGRLSMLDVPLTQSISDALSAGKIYSSYMKALYAMTTMAEKRVLINNDLAQSVVKLSAAIDQDTEWSLPNMECGMLFYSDGVAIYMSDYTEDIRMGLFGFSPNGHTCYAMVDKEGLISGSFHCLGPDGLYVHMPEEMNKWVRVCMTTIYLSKMCELKETVIPANKKIKMPDKKFKHENGSSNALTLIECPDFVSAALRAENGQRFKWIDGKNNYKVLSLC